MCFYKTILKKNIAVGIVEDVDLIFRIVCQISGQGNISYKSENRIG